MEPKPNFEPKTFFRLCQILGKKGDQVPARIPVSRTTWHNWQKAGIAPLPVHIPGTRAALYRAEDIDALIAKLGGAQ